MKLILFMCLITSSIATKAPTASPFYDENVVYPGQYASSTSVCKGIVVGPYKRVSGEILGVCADEHVGACRWACIHDPEGGTPCKNYPGQCIKCKRGHKLKYGLCIPKNKKKHLL